MKNLIFIKRITFLLYLSNMCKFKIRTLVLIFTILILLNIYSTSKFHYSNFVKFGNCPGVVIFHRKWLIFSWYGRELVRVRIWSPGVRSVLGMHSSVESPHFHSKLVILIIKMMNSKCHKLKLCENRIGRVLESIQALENIHFKNAFKIFGAISNQNKLICTIIILIILRKCARNLNLRRRAKNWYHWNNIKNKKRHFGIKS